MVARGRVPERRRRRIKERVVLVLEVGRGCSGIGMMALCMTRC